MKRILSLLAIFTVCVCVFAQQTLPTRDGAAQIENGSGTLKLSVDSSGNGTITPSNSALAIAGATTITGATAVTGALAVTGAISATTTLTGTTGLAVGGGSTILKILSAAATLDFGSVATNATADLTITVTGAGTNSVVILGLPAASDTNFVFNGFVSATNTVTVRAANISTAAVNPAAGSFRATVLQY